MKILPKTRTNNLLVQELESELLVYDLSNNKAFCLNETSALVFQLCDGKRTVLEIADALSVKLKTLVSEDYVRLTLHELNRDGLLENSDEVKAYLNGVNRREIVKKIGFASMIALPLVSSVIAPSAAMAASAALPLFAACSTNSQCASGTCAFCQTDTGSNCPSSQFCCLSTTGGQLLAPGGRVIACVNSCPVNAPSRCCSNQAVAGPTSCGIPGTINCVCA